MSGRRSKSSVLGGVTIEKFLEWKNSGHEQKALVYGSSNQTVKAIMQTLNENQILSMPIYDDNKKGFTHFVSVVDILRFTWSDGERLLAQGRSSPRNIEVIVEEAEAAMGLGDDGSLVETFELEDLVQNLVQSFALGVHRVLVVSDPTSIDFGSHVVSQSDVVKYIHEHAREDDPQMRTTLEEHGFLSESRAHLGPSTLITVPTTATALAALEKLYVDRTNGVGVVDSESKLVANLSASDLRGLDPSTVAETLLLPVTEFVQLTQHGRQVITCTRNSSLREAIDKLVSNRIHRIWIVSDDGKLEGLLTLTDVLCKFAPFDYKLLNSNKV